ncbi:transposase [Nocardia sp. NPDC052278]|uniref:transposase n=1 Tax=unclassified Nocardia TaxID=2637762 RepID=UPI0036C13E84
MPSDPKPTIRKLAAQLGMHLKALRHWISQAWTDVGERHDRPTTDMVEENKQLKERVAALSGSTRYCVLRVRISPRSSNRVGDDRAVRERPSAVPGRARISVLGIAPSTFYEWRKRAITPSARQLADEELLAEIVDIHTSSGGTYGSPRVHAMPAVATSG